MLKLFALGTQQNHCCMRNTSEFCSLFHIIIIYAFSVTLSKTIIMALYARFSASHRNLKNPHTLSNYYSRTQDNQMLSPQQHNTQKLEIHPNNLFNKNYWTSIIFKTLTGAWGIHRDHSVSVPEDFRAYFGLKASIISFLPQLLSTLPQVRLIFLPIHNLSPLSSSFQ